MSDFSGVLLKRAQFFANTFWLALILSLFGLLHEAQASFEPGKWPCAFLARGSSGIAVSHLQNGFVVNPALLTGMRSNSLGVFYRNYYAISDLNDFNLTVRFRLFNVPLGFSFGQFGDKRYREQTAVWAAGWPLGDKLSFGAAVQIFLLNIKRYGRSVAVGSLVALRYKISAKWRVAAVAGNLNEPRLNGRTGDIPVYFSTGLEFKPHKRFSLSWDIFKDERFPFDFRYGLGYLLFPSIEVLVGFRQQVHTFTAGIQIRKTMIRFAYALEVHPDLGVSNAIEVNYVF